MPTLVNGQPLDEREVREEAALIRKRIREENPDVDEVNLAVEAREWARENVIVRMVLRQAAGTESTEELLARAVAHVSRPTSKEVAAFYRTHPEQFRSPAQVHAAHIVKDVDESATEEEARTAIEEIALKLRNGEDFDELADRYSDCQGAAGGDLGFFARGEMVTEFDEVVFAMKPGEISEVFRTVFGFHIVKLIDKREPGQYSLDEVREDIAEKLWIEKEDKATMKFIQELRARAVVKKV